MGAAAEEIERGGGQLWIPSARPRRPAGRGESILTRPRRQSNALLAQRHQARQHRYHGRRPARSVDLGSAGEPRVDVLEGTIGYVPRIVSWVRDAILGAPISSPSCHPVGMALWSTAVEPVVGVRQNFRRAARTRYRILLAWLGEQLPPRQATASPRPRRCVLRWCLPPHRRSSAATRPERW